MTCRDSMNAPNGLWLPQLNLKGLYYGPGCVERNIVGALPSSSSRAIIITGKSLATKTPLVKQLERVLGTHHAGTITDIRQHGPLIDVERAVDTVLSHEDVDTLVSLGGGSPIDTAKVVSLRAQERRGSFLTHVTIPTTLSAAECTAGGGYTQPDGVKVGFRVPGMGVASIFYDASFAAYTPRELWLSSGLRALDHAVEAMYHPTAAEVPWKALALWATSEIFSCLPRAASEENGIRDEAITTRLLLAAYASSGLKGTNLKGGMGLSHSLGHALGSPYGISHGITSCMTLGKVVKLKAQESAENARQIARLLPATGGQSVGSDALDALTVGDRIIDLVSSLNLNVGGLLDRGVDTDEIPGIVQRALGDNGKGPQFDQAVSLVRALF